jgi:RNA polymerase sigma factor (sigma-70 family)
MTQQGSVTRLIQDLRSAEAAVREAAARQIWQRYFGALLALARRHLDARVRRREDEEDVLQSMYWSFCQRQQRGDFDLASRDQLWKLLVTITLSKARNAAHRHRWKCRDVRREQADAARGGDVSGTPCWALEQMDAADPTPAEAAVLNEGLERRLKALGDPLLRRIALRKLEGYTNQEIAGELDVTERTVERKLERIRARWATGAGDVPRA